MWRELYIFTNTKLFSKSSWGFNKIYNFLQFYLLSLHGRLAAAMVNGPIHFHLQSGMSLFNCTMLFFEIENTAGTHFWVFYQPISSV